MPPGRDQNRVPVEVQSARRWDGPPGLKNPPPPIHALVVGPPQELLKLFAHPLVIKRQIAANSADTVVVDLSTSDVALPAGVGAIVRALQPRSVTLRVESTSARAGAVGTPVPDVAATLHPAPPLT